MFQTGKKNGLKIRRSKHHEVTGNGDFLVLISTLTDSEESKIMKININFTVEIDPKEIGLYMHELNAVDESMREFVTSYIVSGGIGSLEEALANNGFDQNSVRRVR